MIPAVLYPLVLLSVGDAGAAIADELRETAQVRPEGARVRALAWAGVSDPLRAQLSDTLDALLEAGRHNAQGGVHLDFALVADMSEVPRGALVELLRAVSATLAERYAVLFPLGAPREGRNVWLNLFLATPPLMGDPAGRDVLAQMEALSVEAAAHPALSRVWLLPRQTTAGTYTDAGVRTALRQWVQGLYLSGVRAAMHSSLAHPPEGRLFSTVAVAAAELPVARVRRYARWRAAWEGLQTLSENAAQPSRDAARRIQYQARLDLPRALTPLREGPPAAALRRHAVEVSGLGRAASALPQVGLWESEAAVRARLPLLFTPVTSADPLGPDDGILHALDEAEMLAIEGLQRALATLLETEVSPDSALAVLPDLQAALETSVRDLSERPLPALAELAPVPIPETDPGLEALEQAWRHAPQLPQLVPVGLVLGLVWGTVAGYGLATWASLRAARAASSLDLGAAPTWLGIAVALGIALIWVVGGFAVAHQRKSQALRQRHRDVQAWREGSGAGAAAKRVEAALDLRLARTTQTMSLQLRLALERLSALRAAVRDALRRTKEHLDLLEIRLGPSQRTDDLHGLLGEDTPLHRALLPPDRLADRVAAARTVPDRGPWAARLLQATWPPSGIVEDLPLLDEEPLARVCDEVFEGLAAVRLLQGADVQDEVARRLDAFLSGAQRALAFGVFPRDAHGDGLLAPTDPPKLIAPIDFKPSLERTSPEVARNAHYGTANSPWVVMARTWEGLTAAELIGQVVE